MRIRTVLWVWGACGVLSLGACGGEDVDPGGLLTSTPTRAIGTDTTTAGTDAPTPTRDTSAESTRSTTGGAAGASPVPKVFDATAMRESVRSVLVDSYAIEGVDSVSCPPKQPVRAQATFDCTAVIDGETQRVPITVQDDRGRYQVGYPEDPAPQP